MLGNIRRIGRLVNRGVVLAGQKERGAAWR